MRVIGLIGGTGWVSSQEYYRLINEMVNDRLGGLTAARCILYSFNYAQIDTFNRAGDAEGVFHLVLDAAEKLERAGAECLLLCANTLHQFADDLSGKMNVPLMHIAEATAREINHRCFRQVGLLGTRTTMEADFYKEKLRQKNIAVLTPEKADREYIHATILTELLKSVISDLSRERFLRIIGDLRDAGAEAIVLGCTEIPLLIKPEDTSLPLVNTLELHCQAAVDFALGEG